MLFRSEAEPYTQPSLPSQLSQKAKFSWMQRQVPPHLRSFRYLMYSEKFTVTLRGARKLRKLFDVPMSAILVFHLCFPSLATDPLAGVQTAGKWVRPISLHYLDQRGWAKGTRWRKKRRVTLRARLSRPWESCGGRNGKEIIKLDKHKELFGFIKNDNFRYSFCMEIYLIIFSAEFHERRRRRERNEDISSVSEWKSLNAFFHLSLPPSPALRLLCHET